MVAVVCAGRADGSLDLVTLVFQLGNLGGFSLNVVIHVATRKLLRFEQVSDGTLIVHGSA